MTTNIHNIISDGIKLAILEAQNDNILPSGINVESISVRYPEKGNNGVFDTNAAFIIGKQIKKAPYAVATILLPYIAKINGIGNVIITGNGFITFDVKSYLWYNELKSVFCGSYGSSNLGKNQPINIEFVSANPTGPLHIGHIRGAVYGDALANLLEYVGYNVTREYYTNDIGGQIDKLAKSLIHRYKEALGYNMGEIPAGLYPGEYLKQIAHYITMNHGDEYLYLDIDTLWKDFKDYAVEYHMDLISDDLFKMGIIFNNYVSEKKLHSDGTFDSAINFITDKDLTYVGRLPKPKSGKVEDWEDTDLLLFKSTMFGDDIDRPLKKSDGTWTYFAGDIAYHHFKYARGFKNMINIWGADHGGYVKRLNAAVNAITDGNGELTTKLCQIVHVVKDGKPFVPSKRNGTYITASDLLDEVGKDVMRFAFLTRKNDSQFIFDVDKVIEKSRDNPVWYIQYSHARAYSVLKAGIVSEIDTPYYKEDEYLNISSDKLDELYSSQYEIDIIHKLAMWPYIVEMSARELEPHRISNYMYELSSLFHSYWTAGNKNKSLRIINVDEPEVTKARLVLVSAIKSIIATGLQLFGVEPMYKM